MENLKGWECPRCHKIHSPFVKECDCNEGTKYIPVIPYMPIWYVPHYPINIPTCYISNKSTSI